MPTDFTPKGRFYDRTGERSRIRGETLSEIQTLPVTPPWGGYTPDLSPELTDFRDCEEVQNFVTVQDILGPPDGYTRIEDASSPTLPLGDSSPPASAGNEQPVTGLFQITDTAGSDRLYATSAGTLGHLYELVNDNWTDIPAAAAVTLTGDTTQEGVARTLCDGVHHTPSNRLILTNNFDPVLYHTPGGATYAELSPATLNPFIARTVEVADGRIIFGNTSESGTRYQNRVRWTTVGGAPALSGLGSGFLDLDEVGGELLRVRKLGNVIVCYLEDGIAFLRRQPNASSPYTREYIDRRRGLLGPFSSCDIGLNRHFCIMTDGFYILTESGISEELGRRIIQGRSYRKFSDTFYSTMNLNRGYRVYCEADIERKLITIIFPGSDQEHPSERWLYDLDTDTVWPMDEATTPNVLGRILDNEAIIGWDDIGDNWNAVVGAWEDFASQTGRLRVGAGTRSGLVWRYTPVVTTYDGTQPTYRYKSFQLALGSYSLNKTWDKFYVGYERIDLTPTAMSISLHNESGVVRTGTITQLLGSAGQRHIDYLDTNDEIEGGHRLGYDIAGTHPLKMLVHEINYRIEGTQVRTLDP